MLVVGLLDPHCLVDRKLCLALELVVAEVVDVLVAGMLLVVQPEPVAESGGLRES